MEQHQEEPNRVKFRQLKKNAHSQPSLEKLEQRSSLEEMERTSVKQLWQKFENLNGEEQIIFKTPRYKGTNGTLSGRRLQQSQMEGNPSIYEAASEDVIDDLSDVMVDACEEACEEPPPKSFSLRSTPPLSREQSKNDEFEATSTAAVNTFTLGGVEESDDGRIEQDEEEVMDQHSTSVSAETSGITSNQNKFKNLATDFPRLLQSNVKDTKLIINENENGNNGEKENKDINREQCDKTGLTYVKPILEELIKTEEAYMENLLMGINNYGNIFARKDLPLGLRGKKYVLLANVEQIVEFHRDEFLPMLLRNKGDLKMLFANFSQFIDDNCFYGYVLFTMNKKRSLKLCETYEVYFERLQTEIGDKLGINSFLLQPIQRMARYPLLLQQFITTLFKHRDFYLKPVIEACCRLEKKIRTLLTMTNESEGINDIVECNDFNVFYQGKFREVSEFDVFDHTLKRGYRSRVFIFDKCMIYTEIKDERLIFRGYYPCERIGIIAKLKSFRLFYKNRKRQECDFNANPAQCQYWLELITDMISSFATEERRKLKEKYSKENDHVHRRPPSLSLFRNSNRFSSDSGIGNM